MAIVGPTASGKSDVAIQLALEFQGEIVSADSRQVYRGLDIGTGKVRGHASPGRAREVMGLSGPVTLVPMECEGVDHWMLDVADPMDVFTAAEFQVLAYSAIADILSRNRIPVLVGGTGLYVHSVLGGLVMPDVPPDRAFREAVEGLSTDDLREQLLAADPDAGCVVDLCNPRRMVRALEVARQTGSVAEARSSLPVPFQALVIGVNHPRPVLVDRIRKRLLSRMREGMIEEVVRLLGEGVTHARMEDLGLTTIGQLQAMPEMRLVGLFGAFGRTLARHVQGDDDRRVTPDRPSRSISAVASGRFQ